MSLRTLIRTGAVLLILGAPLGACGKLGALQKPGPLNGQNRSTERNADDQQREAQDPTHVDTVDPRDRDSDPAPPHILPIPGAGQDPFAAGPSHSLPDPYNQPPR
jgi:hypothetical protein